MGGWTLSFIPGLFWGALFFYIYEPWPFSLAQGPDTETSVEGFHRVMGWTPEDVSGIYYKGYNLRDRDEYLRFDSCAGEIEARVVDGLEVQLFGEEMPAFHQNDRLSWWLEPDEAVRFDRYTADLREVWIDRSSCTFYVRSWTF